jgi:hypothetical protein
MTGDIGQEVESHFRGVGELKVHYHIAGGAHEMDALTRNKAEAELLALLQEFSSTIGAPFQIETKARAEGGVVELWNLVFLHKDHVVLAMSVLAPLLAAPFYRSRLKATLNKPSKISAQTWMTQFFGLLCLSRGPFGQFAGR